MGDTGLGKWREGNSSKRKRRKEKGEGERSGGMKEKKGNWRIKEKMKGRRREGKGKMLGGKEDKRKKKGSAIRKIRIK